MSGLLPVLTVNFALFLLQSLSVVKMGAINAVAKAGNAMANSANVFTPELEKLLKNGNLSLNEIMKTLSTLKKVLENTDGTNIEIRNLIHTVDMMLKNCNETNISIQEVVKSLKHSVENMNKLLDTLNSSAEKLNPLFELISSVASSIQQMHEGVAALPLGDGGTAMAFKYILISCAIYFIIRVTVTLIDRVVNWLISSAVTRTDQSVKIINILLNARRRDRFVDSWDRRRSVPEISEFGISQ